MRELVEKDWLARDGGWGPIQAREVIRRGRKLAQRLQSRVAAESLQPLIAKLDQLEARLDQIETSATITHANARVIWLEAHQIVRQIAFSNPLLRDVPKLLFITRHDARGVFHMVDQFYGFNAKPGGRLLVLIDPLGPAPKLVNLLENAVVTQGRLKGRKLEGGAFLSPEVSFDGQTVLFAWTEATGRDLEWSPSASYHLFRVGVDGGGLRQLTDGVWNDFDPCFLPNGRVAFVSERRGGFLRCGRYCPTYTLFGMAADGSDITCLSYHETHEWQPSVLPDGRIVYTRWDYVDRDTNIAHHPWTCRLDGGDPRAIRGNYPDRRESRPWMEMDIRAIPGSHKLVAVAGAHHGHAFGSLVLIDPRIPDDGAMSQLTRLTPEVPFPEAEQNVKPIAACMVYGSPWPLSEDDHLCVYDPATRNRGIYWIDRWGNKELLYRDPDISCQSPMPLQARPMPPAMAETTRLAANSPGQPAPTAAPATISVINVYRSDFAWPPGSRITALRVIQVLPKSTPAPNVPRIGVAEQTNARAALGTVPVEPDGSAFFEVPAGKAVYFQALDQDGFAIQSMRSATYLQPGEMLSCQGCHEPAGQTPKPLAQIPAAFRRLPSRIQPEPEGSAPFSFVRLVQPVLDRHCRNCHEEKKTLDLSGVIEGKHDWSRSYANLAPKYGFYFHVANGSIKSGVHGGSRTVPGRFGARASGLLPYLDERHYGVRLPPEDHRRITLWLDCNSEFFGSYEQTQAQARGEIVHPALQ